MIDAGWVGDAIQVVVAVIMLRTTQLADRSNARSLDTAGKMSAIEAARRHEEMKPDVKPYDIEIGRKEPFFVWSLELLGPTSLDRLSKVEIEVLDDPPPLSTVDESLGLTRQKLREEIWAPLRLNPADVYGDDENRCDPTGRKLTITSGWDVGRSITLGLVRTDPPARMSASPLNGPNEVASQWEARVGLVARLRLRLHSAEESWVLILKADVPPVSYIY